MLSTTQNATNLYAPIPFCDSQIGDGFSQQVTKSMNYHLVNPTLKDDSGLTFNNYALPLPRKRLRDSSMATTSVVNNNNLLISVPTGKISSQCAGVTAGGSLSFLGEDLTLQLMQQQLEDDRLISLHMEKVRAEIEDRTRKQSIRVIQAIQEAIVRKLKEKDEQIEKIGKLNWAFEERVKSLCLENQVWRDLAQTNEATVNALRSNLEQVVLLQANNKNERLFSGIGTGTASVETDDAQSCCGSSGHGFEEDGDEILRWRKVARTSTSVVAEDERRRMCRRCGAAESCVLLLPCRHLCLCAACGPGVDACPVCNSNKNAIVHVNLS